MNSTVIGILAHVDAGKTTFSEQILFHAGVLRQAGRVDHGDAFLDAHPLEKQRGITIFSDQAAFTREDRQFFWVDTPGHVDFAAEAERASTVLDYAVLLISGAEGVQGHTETLWGMLKRLTVPAFIFVNKTDRQGFDVEGILREVKSRLSSDCVDMGGYCGDGMSDVLIEAIAERDEGLLNRYLSGEYEERLWLQALQKQIHNRSIFPVYFGSALNDVGVAEFLDALTLLSVSSEPDEAPFDALVYKVRHDVQGGRLVFFKVLSGAVEPREEVTLPSGESVKINELRLYSGVKYRTIQKATGGMLICAPGLPEVRPGQRIGAGYRQHNTFAMKPMLSASVEWGRDIPSSEILHALKVLEEEDPALDVTANENTGAIGVDVMGPIQLEVLTRLLLDRFGILVTFGKPHVMYMETLTEPAIGIGHYEPLRHYAEVQLRLSPGAPGSGITFESKCHVDELTLNWQRLIEIHVFEKQHKGVLIGAPLTDVHIELLDGRAHLKHTEGGDFRQSTYRAIRNGLMYAQSQLLEPVVRFRLTFLRDDYGRVMGDLNRMQAILEPPEINEERCTLTGEAPFSLFSDYIDVFMAATHGRGSLHCQFDHYAPCHNAREIIDSAHYNPLSDDTPDSVFCSHGAGYTVPWNEVRSHAHTAVQRA